VGGIALSAGDLERAARVLDVRSRRQASGLFAGNYATAFRGAGLEFEESRPYAPGDDVASIDWNATARSGEPFVKRYRAERNQTLLFALDVSASMEFGSVGTKGTTAVQALALLVAAAARAGDRTALVAFDTMLRETVPIGRGAAHGHRVIRRAVEQAGRCAGETRLAVGLRGLSVATRRRGVALILSDFRDPALLAVEGAHPLLRAELSPLARRHDVVAGVVVDPREEELPAVGPLRVADAERPGRTLWLDTGSSRVRERYRAAAQAWRARLARDLRRAGADVLWLRTDRNPFHALAAFFHDRSARRLRGVDVRASA
jgi:uncharacterized protein (DUF58 family)